MLTINCWNFLLNKTKNNAVKKMMKRKTETEKISTSTNRALSEEEGEREVIRKSQERCEL